MVYLLAQAMFYIVLLVLRICLMSFPCLSQCLSSHLLLCLLIIRCVFLPYTSLAIIAYCSRSHNRQLIRRSS